MIVMLMSQLFACHQEHPHEDPSTIPHIKFIIDHKPSYLQNISIYLTFKAQNKN